MPSRTSPVRHVAFLTAVIGIFALPGLARPAHAGILDCKVILCLAGGFPSGCGDAYRYMVDRITDLPPKPPFGFCAMSNGARYEGTSLDFASLSGRSSYVCAPGQHLSYRVEYFDNGQQQEHAFCYRSSRTVTTGWGEDRRTEVRYEGRTAARRARWRVAVTVELGTPSEYRSPIYYLGYRGGIVARHDR